MELVEVTNGKLSFHIIDINTAKEFIKRNPGYEIMETEIKSKDWKEALNELVSIICCNCDKKSCLNCYVREDKKIIVKEIEDDRTIYNKYVTK